MTDTSTTTAHPAYVRYVRDPPTASQLAMELVGRLGAVETVRYTGDDGRSVTPSCRSAAPGSCLPTSTRRYGAGRSPTTLGGTPCRCTSRCRTSTTCTTARRAGARVDREPHDEAYGARAPTWSTRSATAG